MSNIVDINIALIGFNDNEKTELARLYVYGFKKPTDNQTRLFRENHLFGYDIRININNIEIADLAAEKLKSVQGIIVVFDIDNPESFNELKKLCNEKEIGRNIVVAFAANKGHLRTSGYSGPLVPKEQYKEIESEFNCSVFETSTETGENIENVFNYVAKNVLHSEHLDKDNVEELKKCLIE